MAFCFESSQVVDKMVKATETVILPFLLSGTPDVTSAKWFTVALKLRGVALANGVHGLLSRAWSAAFLQDLQQAKMTAALDDRVGETEDFKLNIRKRHRKVASFFQQGDFQGKVMSTLAAVRLTEQFQLDLCCLDTARKGLAQRRRAQRVAPAVESLALVGFDVLCGRIGEPHGGSATRAPLACGPTASHTPTDDCCYGCQSVWLSVSV